MPLTILNFLQYICDRAAVCLGVDPKTTHNMKEEEKNNKNLAAFFDNEDDKVLVRRLPLS